MTHFAKFSFICLLSCPIFSSAATIPKSQLSPNIVLCEASSGCTNEVIFGQEFKVLVTPRYTVKISISNEGLYTRADLSITNNTTYPLNLSPDDFRVETISPKQKVLSYVPPTDLKNVAPPSSAPTALPVEETKTKAKKTKETKSAKTSSGPIPTTPEEIALAKQKALQDAIDKAAAQKDLEAATVSPNEVTRGRVFFERDKSAREITVVLPIAGSVFEFPFVVRR